MKTDQDLQWLEKVVLVVPMLRRALVLVSRASERTHEHHLTLMNLMSPRLTLEAKKKRRKRKRTKRTSMAQDRRLHWQGIEMTDVLATWTSLVEPATGRDRRCHLEILLGFIHARVSVQA